MAKVVKKCQTCSGDAIAGERFCKSCKRAVLSELRGSGYLTDTKVRVASEQLGRPDGISSRSLGGSAEFVTHDDE